MPTTSTVAARNCGALRPRKPCARARSARAAGKMADASNAAITAASALKSKCPITLLRSPSEWSAMGLARIWSRKVVSGFRKRSCSTNSGRKSARLAGGATMPNSEFTGSGISRATPSRMLRNRSKLRLKIRALSAEGRLSAIFLSADAVLPVLCDYAPVSRILRLGQGSLAHSSGNRPRRLPADHRKHRHV